MAPVLSHAGASPVVTRSPLQLLQYLDVVLVVLATPVALALGAPAFGLLIAVGAWLLQRVLAHTDRRWIARAREPRTQLGLNLAEAFGRIWLLAGAIIVAGVVGGRADGLAAALTICGAYSVAFAIRVISGPPTRPHSTPPQKKGARASLRGSVGEPQRGGTR
jgi:hypothetical protein